MSADSRKQRERKLIRLLLRQVAVFVTVTLLLLIVYWLPPSVKESLELTATSHPATWLTSNYVHEDWSHLSGNLEGYSLSIFVYIALLLTLTALGFDLRRIHALDTTVHATALVAAPLVSAAVWLVLTRLYMPQHVLSRVCGFSTSVSAYVGADIALWVVATAEAFNVRWRSMYFLLQLLLFLLVPASTYTQLTQWLAAASPYMPYISAAAATLLAVRNPKYWKELETKVYAKEPTKASKAIRILLLLCPFIATYMLDGLNPTIHCGEGGTRGRVNVLSHSSGTLVGYASPLVVLLFLKACELLREKLKKLPMKLKP
jgi:hypothetical protein